MSNSANAHVDTKHRAAFLISPSCLLDVAWAGCGMTGQHVGGGKRVCQRCTLLPVNVRAPGMSISLAGLPRYDDVYSFLEATVPGLKVHTLYLGAAVVPKEGPLRPDMEYSVVGDWPPEQQPRQKGGAAPSKNEDGVGFII
jgi:hypothetical protein